MPLTMNGNSKNQMNGNGKKPRDIVLSLVLAAAMLPTSTIFAQGMLNLLDDEYYEQIELEAPNRRGLLNGGPTGGYSLYNQQFGSDENGGYELYNQTFGQEVPSGSGLLILTAAGAGYALRKRKNNKNQKS